MSKIIKKQACFLAILLSRRWTVYYHISLQNNFWFKHISDLFRKFCSYKRTVHWNS